jgi:hypothetical protein
MQQSLRRRAHRSTKLRRLWQVVQRRPNLRQWRLWLNAPHSEGAEVELAVIDVSDDLDADERKRLPSAQGCQCPSGHGDCDGDPTNGCEALVDSVDHCGSCAPCSAPNTTATCVNNGVCQFTCAPGYYDWDGDLANGCESTSACPTIQPTDNSACLPDMGCYYPSNTGTFSACSYCQFGQWVQYSNSDDRCWERQPGCPVFGFPGGCSTTPKLACTYAHGGVSQGFAGCDPSTLQWSFTTCALPGCQ